MLAGSYQHTGMLLALASKDSDEPGNMPCRIRVYAEHLIDN